ncbi:hypothetical protein [Pedobacter sp. FW305-3-2-15-E-R2A2]|jgi:hypothetical protein|uniref:hypothetical protein n=1 Tax=Pedobacter sp. FW305-3-2-15-E-R2A2 TaxID=3140251 RepID=UPI0031409F0E
MSEIKERLKNENAEINKSLFEQAAELKKKSAEINEKLKATIKECDKILHPERSENQSSPKK